MVTKHGNIRSRLLSSCHTVYGSIPRASVGKFSFSRHHCNQSMGQVKSKSSRRRAIDSQQILPKVPDDLRFRVLIIGRANAGKTSILQRVCDTTDSPEIYRLGPQGERQRVCCHSS
jgi:hypothetical protein